MRIIFFGTPGFAVPTLKLLRESGYEIVSVVTQPDRVKGRGHILSMPPVKEYAISENIPVLQPSGIRSSEFFAELTALNPDMIVVVAYGRIIPPAILQLPPMGCINVHASLLPKYRGAAPIQWAIVNGEAKTGVTTMMMDEGIDTGDMLLNDETEILADDNSLTLGQRLSTMGAALLIKTIKGLKDGSVTRMPQSGESSYALIIKKEDGKIDWSLPAHRIWNLVRGMYPWPGAFCDIQGQRLSVIKARVSGDAASGRPGCIQKTAGAELFVSTGSGVISLIEVKPEGKSTMSGAAFANGRRLKEGACFES